MKKEICYLIVLTFVMFPFLIVGLRNLANGNPHTKKGKVFFGFYNWTSKRLPYWLHSALIGCPSQMPLFWLPLSFILICFSFPEVWGFAQENVLKSALLLALSTLYASGASVVLYYNYGFLQGRDNNLKEPDYLGLFLKEHQKLQTTMDMLNARGGTEITDLFYLKEYGRIQANLAKLEREQLKRSDSGTFNGLSAELILSKKAEIMKQVFDYVPRQKLVEATDKNSEDLEHLESQHTLEKRKNLEQEKMIIELNTKIIKLSANAKILSANAKIISKEKEEEKQARISESGFHALEIVAHQETIDSLKLKLEEAKKEEEKIKVLELKLQGRDSANADLKKELKKRNLKAIKSEKKLEKAKNSKKKQLAEQKKIRKAKKKALAKSLKESKGYAKEAMELITEVPTSSKTKVKNQTFKQTDSTFNSGGKSTVIRKADKNQNIATSDPEENIDFGGEAIDNINNSNKNSVEEIEEI